jgi:hypothetical protein
MNLILAILFIYACFYIAARIFTSKELYAYCVRRWRLLEPPYNDPGCGGCLPVEKPKAKTYL